MLTLGGIDTRADLSPMVYARNVASTGWFTVFVKNIYIREQVSLFVHFVQTVYALCLCLTIQFVIHEQGGQSATADGPHQKTQRVNADLFEMNSGKGVIVDSGTTDTYLHSELSLLLVVMRSTCYKLAENHNTYHFSNSNPPT